MGRYYMNLTQKFNRTAAALFMLMIIAYIIMVLLHLIIYIINRLVTFFCIYIFIYNTVHLFHIEIEQTEMISEFCIISFFGPVMDLRQTDLAQLRFWKR